MECPLCKTNIEVENKTKVVLKSRTVLELGDSGLVEAINKLELAMLKNALQQTGNNKTNAAKLLGIPFHSIRYYIEKHKLK